MVSKTREIAAGLIVRFCGEQPEVSLHVRTEAISSQSWDRRKLIAFRINHPSSKAHSFV